MKPSALNLFRRPTLRCVRCLMLVTGLVLAGSSGSRAQVLPKDPVEQFKEALLLERTWSTSYKSRMDADEDALKLALDFRKKNLTEKAAKLATLSELSRALLLIEWPKPVKPSDLRTYPLFDQSSFEIEGEVRKKMGDQFIKMVREATRKPANSADEVARLTATLDLVGETVASAGDLQDENLVLYRELEPLAKDIATLADAPSDEVRRYAAKALGQFPYNARVACAALEKLLTTENQETTRLAAATALASLVQSASSNQPIKGSEPNVSVREVRKSAKLFSLPEVVQLLRQVVKVAGIGMNDASPAVRRECAQAMRQSAETLTFQIKVLVPLSKQETSLPPKERAWSEDEKKMVEERREQDAENIETILSAMRAFKNQTDGFTRAVVDANPAVRLESRRALDSLVQCRELLEKLRKSVPSSSEIKPKKPAKKRQDVRSDVPSVPGFPVTARQEKKNEANPPDNQPEKRKEKNRKEDRDDDDTKPQKKEDKPEKDTDTDPDPIGTLARKVANTIVNSGFRDPDPRARRAAVGAFEAMEEAGIPYIPHMLERLKDPDLFVRWISARALGKIAPHSAKLVVPALIGLLDDEDLDPRMAAAMALGNYGTEACSAIGPLSTRMLKGDVEFRLVAMKAIEEIGQAGTAALPSFAQALENPDGRVRAEAARIMGRYGKASHEYVPALKKLLGDPDMEVRKSASSAIVRILSDVK